MGFNCGIVGLPNVGKSTIFNALTKSAQAESANYPFCTIEPNRGIVPVPDERMEFITRYVKPKSIVPTAIEFVDIAGLVKGASEGEGRGNAFLTNVREVEAIAHIVRCFKDEGITHVEGDVDPARDIEIINMELLLSDLQILERAEQRIRKQAKSGDAALKKKHSVIEGIMAAANDGTMIKKIFERNPGWEEEVAEFNLITAKPMLYVANVGESDLPDGNELVDIVRKIAEAEGSRVVVLCGAIESDVIDLSEEEAKEYLAELGLERSGLDSLIKEGYALLNLITYFTAGEKEVRAWTIEKGTVAQKAAGKIHTDIERGFIRAEVTGYNDFVEFKSLAVAKEKGKMRLEGKEYVVQDGDIMYFRFNV